MKIDFIILGERVMNVKIHNNTKEGYRFSVYKHNLVVHHDKLVTRQFIVLKKNGIIIAFTDFHKYVHSSNKRGAKSIFSNGGNRFKFVVQFLNYIFIEKLVAYKISKLTQITLKMIQDFFIWYGLDENKPRQKSTVDQCSGAIIDFMVNFIRCNPGLSQLEIDDFTIENTYWTPQGKLKTRLIPNFDIFYLGKQGRIFRDIPNAAFDIICAYAETHYKDIFFMIVVSGFTGLRPSEVCNMRQEISPLGSGLSFVKINGKTKSITIDLNNELNLRSDLVSVGRIKKERSQEVYPSFLDAFEFAYAKHKNYLKTCKFESDYCPMFVNSRGMAMTYDNYLVRFKQLMAEIIPIMLSDHQPEVVEFANNLMEYNIAPHIFRHWFTVRITLYGEDIAGIQYWRGDNSPESALTYWKNKGELKRQLMTVNNNLFDYMSFQATIKKGLNMNG